MEKASFVRLLPFLWTAEDCFVRVFLAVGDESALLIDTGLGDLQLHTMAAQITDKPLMVVNTHSDGDHIGGNAQFPKVYLHPDEQKRYAAKGTQPEALLPIREGERIDLGGISFRVLLTPGHTPGSISLLEENTGVLICGDTIQTAPIYMFGEGRDIQAYIATLKRLCAMASQFQKIYPSHGQIELSSDAIGGLEEAAKKLAAGELQPEPAPQGMPCKLYRWNGFAFYY